MIDNLKRQLSEIEQFINQGDQLDEQVSKVGTYWHLDHTLNVFKGILSVLETSDPKDYNPRFSFLKWGIMTFGKMPRGKGKAPERTLSNTPATKEILNDKLSATRELLPKMEKLPKEATFKHPLFGWLNKKDTLKFIRIHTHHHLKIIRDIAA